MISATMDKKPPELSTGLYGGTLIEINDNSMDTFEHAKLNVMISEQEYTPETEDLQKACGPTDVLPENTDPWPGPPPNLGLELLVDPPLGRDTPEMCSSINNDEKIQSEPSVLNNTISDLHYSTSSVKLPMLYVIKASQQYPSIKVTNLQPPKLLFGNCASITGDSSPICLKHPLLCNLISLPPVAPVQDIPNLFNFSLPGKRAEKNTKQNSKSVKSTHQMSAYSEASDDGQMMLDSHFQPSEIETTEGSTVVANPTNLKEVSTASSRQQNCCESNVQRTMLLKLNTLPAVSVRTTSDNSNTGLVDDYMKNWTQTGRFSCVLCPYSSVTRNYLLRHWVMRHSNIKPYKCPYCCFTSCYKYGMKKHLTTTHHSKPKDMEIDFDLEREQLLKFTHTFQHLCSDLDNLAECVSIVQSQNLMGSAEMDDEEAMCSVVNQSAVCNGENIGDLSLSTQISNNLLCAEANKDETKRVYFSTALAIQNAVITLTQSVNNGKSQATSKHQPQQMNVVSDQSQEAQEQCHILHQVLKVESI